MTKPENNRLVRTFAELRAAGSKTLVPFITAGYPDLPTTEALLGEFEARGVRICELGVPFSDPIADGPVIQASYTEALAAGIDSDGIFKTVRSYRNAGGEMALAAMVSYSIIYRHGVEDYLQSAADAGFDAFIVPDLPLDEAAEFESQAAARGLCNVMLIAPTTPPDRRLEIAGHSRGFIYYISVAGITGERDGLPEETIRTVAELRKHTDTPVCVGFGISNAETVAHVCRVADGAIVGSAIVHRIEDNKDAPRKKLAKQIGEFVSELLAPVL
ncbi:MAG: tryptophan synthase subunit alpha [Planctomycetota bacterium]|nr:tryptophan synthase subunit alpha [Planctomycetota bacterium]